MKHLLLLLTFSLGAMEPSFNKETVLEKLEAMKDRPFHKQLQFWKPNEEYLQAKLAVNDYLRELQHSSHVPVSELEQRRSSLETLIQAAHEVRVQEESKSHKLSAGSKIKIGTGANMITLSLAQIGISLATTKESYKMTADIVVSLGGLVSGGLLVYEGLKNVDSKADAGKAAHIHLLLLEKFQEINSERK